MAKFILRAPDADKRRLEDYRHRWQEFSYTETVEVIDGIAECNDETTKHMLTGLGYVLVNPDQICECGHITLSDEEFSQHSEECAEARRVEEARKASEAREIEAERKAKEIEVERKAKEARKVERARKARETRVAREAEKARKAREAYEARVARKKRATRRVRQAYELIKTRFVCKTCGHVCMLEEEFADHRRTCITQNPRL